MSYELNTPFYILRTEEQEGPVTLEEIQGMLSAGDIKPEHHCWTEGMDAWEAVANLFPGQTPIPSPTVTSIPERSSEVVNPYAPPRSSLADTPTRRLRESYYGGLGRLSYFLITTGLSVLQGALEEAHSLPMSLGLVVVVVAGMLYATLLRIKNLGMTRWWLLWMIVPGLNLVGWYRLTFCQEGWGDSRTLDKTGRVLVWIFVVIILLAIGSVLLIGPEGLKAE